MFKQFLFIIILSFYGFFTSASSNGRKKKQSRTGLVLVFREAGYGSEWEVGKPFKISNEMQRGTRRSKKLRPGPSKKGKIRVLDN